MTIHTLPLSGAGRGHLWTSLKDGFGAGFRWAAPVAMTVLCLWAFEAKLGLPSLAELGHTLAALPAWGWLGASIATAISFWALGRYDSVAHRHLQTGLDGAAARRAGMAAIAFSQTAGFGLITGTYARWRLLPGLTALQAAKITALVGFTFMATLAAIAGVALVLFPPIQGFGWIGGLLLAGFICAVGMSFWFPSLRIGKLRLRWPSLIALAALMGWTLIDVVAAGTALWMLLPDTVQIAWSMLVPVYLIALGAAILSSAPGGAGPLELTVCALLPSADTSALVGALVAFRLVYYVLPAALACGMLFLPGMGRAKSSAPTDADLLGARRTPAADLPASRACAETAIIRQNGGHVQALGLNQLAILDSPQCTVAFFDPLSGHTLEVFAPLAAYARQRNGSACFYKCGARTGTQARKAGWKILRIAQEAVVRPTTFSDSGSSHRQLRRKLRHAEKAGLKVMQAPASLPIDQMGAIDAAWQSTHGHAHGTTMGRFEPGYLAEQRVFLAWKDGRLEGFVSLHATPGEWCLDLIRIVPDAPDGTGHALVRTAIAAAALENVPRLSLAAVPDHRWAKHTDPGLRRFKSCFTPRWEPRYLASPSWPQMAVSLIELLRLVHRPGPVQPVLQTSSDDAGQTSDAENDLLDRYPAHNELEQNEIALRAAP